MTHGYGTSSKICSSKQIAPSLKLQALTVKPWSDQESLRFRVRSRAEDGFRTLELDMRGE